MLLSEHFFRTMLETWEIVVICVAVVILGKVVVRIGKVPVFFAVVFRVKQIEGEIQGDSTPRRA